MAREVPSMIRMTLRQPRLEHDSVRWLQRELVESKYVCGLPEDGVFGNRTAAEVEEMLYRLGHPDPKPALSIDDLWTINAWASFGRPLPDDWAETRIERMERGFREGWGITKASWDCLHKKPEPPLSKFHRPMEGAISGGAYGYGDPEGQGGRHWAIDIFGVEGGRTPVYAVEDGIIERASESQDHEGQVFGGVTSLRSTDGKRYWVNRHTDPLHREGTKVEGGQQIGNVEIWRDGHDHDHLELYGAGATKFEYSGPPLNINPYLFLKEKGVI